MVDEVILVEQTACEILAELQTAYRNVVMGKTPKRILQRSDTGAQQEIDHQRLDLKALQGEIRRYQTLCDIEMGRTGNQFCITAG